MKQKLFISLILLSISLTSYAEWKVGLCADYENTGATWKKNGTKIEIDNANGFGVGPSVSYSFNNYFELSTGLSFVMNGFVILDESIYAEVNTTVKENTNLYSIKLPIYAIGKLPIKDFNLLLEIGPEFSYGVASTTTTTTIVPEYNLTFTSDRDDAYQEIIYPFNACMHFAIGAEYEGARLLVGYDLGIIDIGRNNNNDMKTNGFFVAIGYMYSF